MLAGYAQIAAIYGEQQAFVDTTKNLVTTLRLHAPQAVAILEDQFYAEQLARSIGKTYRSGRILHTVATVCGDEGMTVDTMLRHLHDTVESGTRHPLALVAALENGTGYRAALRSGAAKCIRTVREAGYDDLTDSLDLDVRNVVAHRSYRLTTGGGIDVLNGSGNLKKHITAAELVDLLAGGSILALSLIAGVVLFASESGLDIPRLLEAADTHPIEQTCSPLPRYLAWLHSHHWLRFAHSLRRGDQLATPARLWRTLVLAHARQAVEPGGVTTIRNLVALRAIVRECDDEPTAHTLTELINSYREQLHDTPNPGFLATSLPDGASTTTRPPSQQQNRAPAGKVSWPVEWHRDGLWCEFAPTPQFVSKPRRRGGS